VTELLAAVLGLFGGIFAGLFGVGGGVMFVPTLVLVLGLTQVHAEATSLLAIIPTVLVGAWRQRTHGNLRWRPALIVGLASIAGVEGGARIARALPEDVLRRLFAVLMFVVAANIVWRTLRRPT
jgi:uncharacterized membrane protein YfcA